MHLSYARLPKAHNHLAHLQERGADDNADLALKEEWPQEEWGRSHI
jgi:hypothetical protein